MSRLIAGRPMPIACVGQVDSHREAARWVKLNVDALVHDCDGRPLQVTPYETDKLIDPVGAGDAFAAVTMPGLLNSRDFYTVFKQHRNLT